MEKSNNLAPSSLTLSSPSTLEDFPSLFTNLNTLLLSSPNPKSLILERARANSPISRFSSISVSGRNPNPRSLLKSVSLLDRALIGAAAGGIAGAFTYVCLLPIDTVKTKLQTKGAAQIYSSALDAAVKTFKSDGILGFYRGVSAVLVGSASSSAIYFGTCEFGKSLLSKLPNYPPILIPPTAGAMGNIVSSAIMVPKELITQRMQAGAKGRSWEVMLRILEKDGILGLYAGYSATLLRNLPAGILSYSSFEYLKAFVLGRTRKGHLEPVESVCCGALAGVISASLTTPLDVVKTRLMTQVRGQGGTKVSETVRQILMQEGWTGFTRGIGPRVLHSACFAALGYFAFETARLAILSQYIERRKESATNLAVQINRGIKVGVKERKKTLESQEAFSSVCERSESTEGCKKNAHPFLFPRGNTRSHNLFPQLGEKFMRGSLESLQKEYLHREAEILSLAKKMSFKFNIATVNLMKSKLM